jgi:integrase
VAVHTGLRQGELLGLKWGDVNLEAGTLSLQRSLDTDGTFNPPKRNKNRRTVKLTAQSVEALNGRKAT